MSEQTVRYLALISAANARIVAMQADNQQRAVRGDSVAWTSYHFFSEAQDLETMARELLG